MGRKGAARCDADGRGERRVTDPGVRVRQDECALFGYGSLISIESMESSLGRRYDGRVWDTVTRPDSDRPDGVGRFPSVVFDDVGDLFCSWRDDAAATDPRVRLAVARDAGWIDLGVNLPGADPCLGHVSVEPVAEQAALADDGAHPSPPGVAVLA